MTTHDEPEIHKLMVLSTAHITLDVDSTIRGMAERGDRKIIDGVYCDPYEYGWHLVLLDKDEPQVMIMDPRISKPLEEVVAYARTHGCTHLRIDRDGPTMKDLPTYNW